MSVPGRPPEVRPTGGACCPAWLTEVCAHGRRGLEVPGGRALLLVVRMLQGKRRECGFDAGWGCRGGRGKAVPASARHSKLARQLS